MSIEAQDFAGLLRQDVQSSMFEGYDQQPSVIPQVTEVIPYSQGPKKMYWIEARAVKDSEGDERRPGGDIKEVTAHESRKIPYAWKLVASKITIPDEIKMFLQDAPNGMISDRLADDVRDIVRPQALMLGKERARKEEEIVASVFNNGGLTAGYAKLNQTIEIFDDANGDLGYDGKPPFVLSGNDRTARDGSTYYNGLNLTLSAANLDTALQLMESTNCFDEMGRTIHVRAGQLIIPPALKQAAIQIIRARALAGTGNNDANPYADLDLIVWNHLTDTDQWTLQDPTLKGFRFYEGGAPMVKVRDGGNFSAVIEVQWKYALNFREFRGMVSSRFATS